MRTAQTVLTVIQERGKQHKPIERVYKLYCDHFLAHEQERELVQEAENAQEPEQMQELSPQSQAFMMDM
ncbi:MAG: hypothetical protein ACLTWO_02325 [Blautia massiliensis (ex Durand et al. 2017)]